MLKKISEKFVLYSEGDVPADDCAYKYNLTISRLALTRVSNNRVSD